MFQKSKMLLNICKKAGIFKISSAKESELLKKYLVESLKFNGYVKKNAPIHICNV